MAAPATAVDFRKARRVDGLEVGSPRSIAGLFGEWLGDIEMDDVMEVGPFGGIVMGGIAYPEKVPASLCKAWSIRGRVQDSDRL